MILQRLETWGSFEPLVLSMMLVTQLVVTDYLLTNGQFNPNIIMEEKMANPL